jgi:RHS repeat-associated protein
LLALVPRTQTLLTARRRWRIRLPLRRRASGRAHYNYFRDYDPAVGGYIESDPIGVWGGYATFAYALGNPAGLVDPDGLNGKCPVLTVDKKGPWNKLDTIASNNCYSYARNKPDSHLAPPGLRTDRELNCSSIIAAALKDGMSKVPQNGSEPRRLSQRLQPERGWSLWEQQSGIRRKCGSERYG